MALQMTRVIWPLYICVILVEAAVGCGFPGAPAHSSVTFSTAQIRPGSAASYTCERGFELLGPARRVCRVNGTWTPDAIPFCVINVAAGKAPMQSTTDQEGIPQKAVDGSTSRLFDPQTCTLTQPERAPLWYVNLLEPYMVQLVRVDFGRPCCGSNISADVVVRVGNNRPDLETNPICNRFTGVIEEGQPLFLPCSPPMPGAFVSVHLRGASRQRLSICETFVYTDQALPVERCPQFRDQPPGAIATYSGRCYTFYNQQPKSFKRAQEFCSSRGGSLIDETSPALQGFLSWELWRRHKSEPAGQYWLGAVREPGRPAVWSWLHGRPVTVSFWSLPTNGGQCARLDATRDWLWAATDCGRRIHFVCQHEPLTCGRPEQPPNSTLTAVDFGVGARIVHRCQPGHLLVGPEARECLPSGFYSGYPPTCKRLQCGLPADIAHGSYQLQNDSRAYLSTVEYRCRPGHTLVGRASLVCDVDERWNGPPPRCQPVGCGAPPTVLNGAYRSLTNVTAVGALFEYYCLDDRFTLIGPRFLRCQSDGSYDQEPPVCRAGVPASTAAPEPAETGEYDRPEQSKTPDTVNIQQNTPPGVRLPDLDADQRDAGPRLNLSGIIALGIFGGFVFLSAVLTTIVIIVRRTCRRPPHRARRHYISSSYSTDSETHGLSQRPHSQGYRDAGELTVADVAHVYRADEKRRHHHHHHHRRHHGDERPRRH
ncbi:seizure 6-like protein 2 [Pollicipes pollicipes]|uniref:seizure 6-like protein 2 n=1 Tax=Pollicipes pollicipes TaxID=41117 RepID=UPI001884F7CA|nr:seizure 6-like protein 2 [Pollicipes pollicipes]